MSNNLIQYAFGSGEISPKLYGRSDLEKYDLGVALAKNFFVDYNGGLSTRPGTEFLDRIQHDDQAVRLVRFSYAPDIAQTYTLLFGDEYVRFIQDGGYVLESAKNITGATSASSITMTVVGHGYSLGDWIKIEGVVGMPELNGRTWEVRTVLSSDTFVMGEPNASVAFNSTGLGPYVSGGTTRRIYTVTTPYAAEDLEDLVFHQRRNDITITHKDYAPRELTRVGATSWSLSTLTFDNTQDRPATLALSWGFTASNGGYIGAVTAVDQNGNESLPQRAYFDTGLSFNNGGSDGFTQYGYVNWTWSAVAGAEFYNLYRSFFRHSTPPSGGERLGFLDKLRGTSYVDGNSTPDYTLTPPTSFDPFANGAVLYIVVTASGSGYDVGDTPVVSGGGGSGFLGQLVVSATGAVEAVIVLRGGRNYSGATISITTSGGSGFTGTVALSPSSGNNPALSSTYQQRRVFAATENQPLTIWGSYIGNRELFTISDIVAENEGYEHDLDTEDAAPIRHIVPTRGGLLVMTQTSIMLLTGGTDRAISSTNALADPQSYNGCAKIAPIRIGTDLLYVEGKGSIVRLLSYNDFSKVYGGTNMSILANHLFPTSKELTEWTHAQAPHNLIWARRNDGALLSFTFVQEQNLYAWTQNWTKGLFENVLATQENTVDTTYLVVSRYVDGKWRKYLERFHPRDFIDVEDAWCVDAGLTLGATYPAATLSMSAPFGEGVVATASASVFSSGDVGSVIRVGGGKAYITQYNAGDEVVCNVVRAITSVIPETEIPLDAASGSWTMDAPVTTLSGLWHLEGEEVVALADGNVVTGLTVTDGAVTLPEAATRVTIGLSYTCVMQTLPPTARDQIIEHKRKNVVGVSLRAHDTRGLKYGSSLTKLYEAKERTNEIWGEAITLQNGFQTVAIEAPWEEEAQTYFVQDYPLPATILGLVLDLEIGDDND